MSYSHAADGKLAAALQRGLQRIGKPWYRGAVVKIFRDETSLAVSPELWPQIERHLGQCEFFILMASMQAAGSPWVRKEVQWWLAHRAVEQLFIVVTDGDITWDAASNDFDWNRTTCLPPDLRRCFRGEPLYVDLRWAKGRDDLSLRHAGFRNAVLTLAAPLHGRPKDVLDSEEIREHRRFRWAASTAVILLNLLGLAALYAFWNARQETARAETNWRQAESRRLARIANERSGKITGIEDAITVALMGWRLAPTDEARAALEQLARASSDMARILGQHTAGIAALAASPDGSLLATMGGEGSIQLWKAGLWVTDGAVLAGELHGAEGLRFSATGTRLLAWAKDGAMELWDLSSRTKRSIAALPRSERERRRIALNAEGSLIAVGGEKGLLAVWDINGRTLRRSPGDCGDKDIIGVHFGPDGRLWAIQNQYDHLRACVWDIDSGKVSVGPSPRKDPIADPYLRYQEVGSFSRGGTRFLTEGDGVIALWEIAPGLAVRQMTLPRGLKSVASAALDANGDLLFVQSGSPPNWTWQVWSIGATPELRSQGTLTSWGKVAWSPDARWRAEVVPGGWRANDDRGQRVLVWDMGPAAAERPAAAIKTQCNFGRDQDQCARRLCEKVAPSLNEAQLRELFGIENFVVMYDRYKEIIQGSLCDGQ